MNRYPLWKYAILVVALLISAIYALPNLFGEAPAVQDVIGAPGLSANMRSFIERAAKYICAPSGMVLAMALSLLATRYARLHPLRSPEKA